MVSVQVPEWFPENSCNVLDMYANPSSESALKVLPEYTQLPLNGQLVKVDTSLKRTPL